MKVTELIEITNRLAVNHTKLTAKERETYLTFLNMANLELYALACTGMRTLNIRVKVFLDNATQSFILPNNLYNIRQVLCSSNINPEPILPSPLSEDLSALKGYIVEGKNLYCDLVNTYFTLPTAVDPIDGVTKKYITLVYCSNPLKLVETITDPASEIDEPVYPPLYHHFLVYGALYHFYLANRVFLEKSDSITRKWEACKQEIEKFKLYGL